MAQSTTEKAREAVERLKPGERELTPAAKTIAAAATAAVAGGLAAALKALVEHRSDDEEREDDGRQEEPTPSRDQAGDEDEQAEREPDEQEQSESPEASGRDDDEEDDREERQREQREDDDSGTRQAPDGGAARIVEAGKSELEALLGQQVESVSGFSRSDDGWCVTYEVVEMRRIPDSSDVLSSYAVVLDDDGDLMTMERKHRYRRAQVDDG